MQTYTFIATVLNFLTNFTN